MSTTTTSLPLVIPPEVTAFAAEEGASEYLPTTGFAAPEPVLPTAIEATSIEEWGLTCVLWFMASRPSARRCSRRC